MPANAIRFKVPEHVVARRVDDETVILNLDSGTYFGLDSVGSRFFELLGEKDRLDLVIQAMLLEFDVSEPQLEADLLRLCDELKASGLLESA